MARRVGEKRDRLGCQRLEVFEVAKVAKVEDAESSTQGILKADVISIACEVTS